MIHVCSLAALPETVRATGASHIVTVMANVNQVQRPASVRTSSTCGSEPSSAPSRRNRMNGCR